MTILTGTTFLVYGNLYDIIFYFQAILVESWLFKASLCLSHKKKFKKWFLVDIGYIRMGDHFVFLVDRLLTESTLEAALESRKQKELASSATNTSVADCSSLNSDPLLSPGKMVECRICQEEDMDSNMEVPCSCCGSLKVCRVLLLLFPFFWYTVCYILDWDVLKQNDMDNGNSYIEANLL